MFEYDKSLTGVHSSVNKDAMILVNSYPKVPLTVDCVIFGFTDNSLKVLLIKSD